MVLFGLAIFHIHFLLPLDLFKMIQEKKSKPIIIFVNK
jgi:hypothetical protein